MSQKKKIINLVLTSARWSIAKQKHRSKRIDMDSKETTLSLWKQIENNRILSVSGKYFVPPASLVTIFTPPAIAKAVAELNCEPDDRIGLSQAIQGDGVITFAILVWMHHEEAIIEFRRKRCLDSRGPLDESTALSIAPEFGATFSREVQWEFRPYFFRRGEDVEIGSAEILPYTKVTGEQMRGGHGGLVQLEIHPSLQDFYLDEVCWAGTLLMNLLTDLAHATLQG